MPKLFRVIEHIKTCSGVKRYPIYPPPPPNNTQFSSRFFLSLYGQLFSSSSRFQDKCTKCPQVISNTTKLKLPLLSCLWSSITPSPKYHHISLFGQSFSSHRHQWSPNGLTKRSKIPYIHVTTASECQILYCFTLRRSISKNLPFFIFPLATILNFNLKINNEK